MGLGGTARYDGGITAIHNTGLQTRCPSFIAQWVSLISAIHSLQPAIGAPPHTRWRTLPPHIDSLSQSALGLPHPFHSLGPVGLPIEVTPLPLTHSTLPACLPLLLPAIAEQTHKQRNSDPTLQATIHSGGNIALPYTNCHEETGFSTPVPTADGFHVLALEWSRKEMRFYADGSIPYLTVRRVEDGVGGNNSLAGRLLIHSYYKYRYLLSALVHTRFVSTRVMLHNISCPLPHLPAFLRRPLRLSTPHSTPSTPSSVPT